MYAPHIQTTEKVFGLCTRSVMGALTKINYIVLIITIILTFEIMDIG